MNQPKPPLGLLPRSIWLEKRRFEILRAMRDYAGFYAEHSDPGDGGANLLGEWACELIYCEHEIKKNEAMNKKPE